MATEHTSAGTRAARLSPARKAPRLDELSVGAGDAVITFSPWDTWRDARLREFCRPPDQVYKSLVESDRVERLLVVDPWRSGPIDVVRRAQGRRAEFPSTDTVLHLRPRGLRRRDPIDASALRRRYARYGDVVCRAAERRGLRTPALVTFNPFVAAFSPAEWCRSVIYYGRDDWTAFRRNTHLTQALRQAQEAMRARGITVCAVSRVLADRIAGPGEGIVIPNGIDEAIWLTPAEPPARVRELPRPCGIYAGTIDDRLDVDAVRQLVAADLGSDAPLASAALAGPVADDEVGRRLAAEPRIHLLGDLSQRELVGALMWADVCLLPHNDTPLTQAMSPLKLYEYLASGTPVVATDLPPVRDVDPRVRLVADGDYRGAVVRALGDEKLSARGRADVVRASSWRGRHERLLDAMFGPLGTGPPPAAVV